MVVIHCTVCVAKLEEILEKDVNVQEWKLRKIAT